MTRRTRLLILAGTALTLAALLIVPACRWRVVGWVRDEAFYQGRPTSYWAEVLFQLRKERAAENAASFRPSLWTQFLAGFGHAESVTKVSLYKVGCEAIDPEDMDEYDWWRGQLVRAGPRRPNPRIAAFGGEPLAVPVLAQMLTDKDDYVRIDAAQALGEIGPPAKVAVPALVTALRDEDYLVRRNAAWALGRIGLEARIVVPALVAALRDKNPAVQENAARALAGIDPQAAAAAGVP